MAKIKKIIQLDELKLCELSGIVDQLLELFGNDTIDTVEELEDYISRQDYLIVSIKDRLWLLDSANQDLDILKIDLDILDLTDPKGLLDGSAECFSILELLAFGRSLSNIERLIRDCIEDIVPLSSGVLK